MAKFSIAFDYMMKQEGGYCLHEVKGDRGGQTFAGIARNFHPNWEGWPLLDTRSGLTFTKSRFGPLLTGGINEARVKRYVAEFYILHFWQKVRGDAITSQIAANAIFSFAVNAGPLTAIKVTQAVLGVAQDGDLGPKTLANLEALEEERFVVSFAFGKIKRYAQIVKRNPTQAKFMPGWVNRTIDDLEAVYAS